MLALKFKILRVAFKTANLKRAELLKVEDFIILRERVTMHCYDRRLTWTWCSHAIYFIKVVTFLFLGSKHFLWPAGDLVKFFQNNTILMVGPESFQRHHLTKET